MNKIYQQLLSVVKNARECCFAPLNKVIPASATQVISKPTAHVIAKGCSWESQPYKTAKRLGLPNPAGCQMPGHDGACAKRLGWRAETVSRDTKRECMAGFTLIELLVVVLIIGILAAVALPQYQKAVYKSRAMQGYLWFNKLEDAQKLFYAANGYYATSADELDFDFTTGTSLEFSTVFAHNISSVWDNRRNGLFWEFNFNRPNGEYVKFCLISHRSSYYEYGKQLCREFGGVYSSTGGSGPQDYFILPNR